MSREWKECWCSRREGGVIYGRHILQCTRHNEDIVLFLTGRMCAYIIIFLFFTRQQISPIFISQGVREESPRRARYQGQRNPCGFAGLPLNRNRSGQGGRRNFQTLGMERGDEP